MVRLVAGLPTLGDDLDDAARRLGSIDRRGRRAADHFDALDVVGVDVVQPSTDLRCLSPKAAGHGDRTGRRRTVDADSVDINEWAVTETEACSPTNQYVRAGTQAAGRRQHQQSGSPCGEQGREVRRRRLRQRVSRIDRRHGVADRPARFAPGGSRHDDLVEHRRAHVELEVNVRWLTRRRGYPAPRGDVTDVPSDDGHCVGGHVHDPVPTVRAARRAESRALELQSDTSDRLRRARVGHPTDDGRLGMRRSGEQRESADSERCCCRQLREAFAGRCHRLGLHGAGDKRWRYEDCDACSDFRRGWLATRLANS